jgi:hypothetical protein
MRRQALHWATQRFSNAAIVDVLIPILGSTQRQGTTDAVPEPPAYAPSAFAQRYEAHKRHCGWYATDEQLHQRWYPPMFQGRDYQLYEILIEPYATYHAASIPARAISGSWVPYIVAGIELDALRQMVTDLDPIWPQRQFLPPVTWDILHVVDGVTSIDQLVTSLSAQRYSQAEVRAGIWQLYVDGIIMLKRANPPEAASRPIHAPRR